MSNGGVPAGKGSPAPSATLADLIRLHGEAPFRDMIAVHWPSSHQAFVERLYRALDVIIRSLEDDADVHFEAGEVAISRNIVRQLERTGYLAAAEQHTRGHVDVTVRSADGSKAWLGEAKIHNGNAYLAGGLTQLLSRYATGRDPDGGLLIFVQKKGCDTLMSAWRSHLMKKKVEKLQQCEEDDTVRCFRSVHTHDSGSEYRVRHMGIHLYYDPRDG